MPENLGFAPLFINKSPFLPVSPMSEVQKDLIAGSLAGLCNVLTGHPLDTIKVRMQIFQTSFRKTVKYLIRTEGALALYKGMRSPLYSAPLLSSISFATYESAIRFQGLKRGDARTTSVALLSGIWAGFVFSIAITPIDVIKNKLQMEGVGRQVKSSKVRMMAKKVMKHEGPRGLFKGLGATFFRDLPYFSIQFALYEKSKELLSHRFGDSFSSLVAGGVSVLCAWTFSYPQDTLKTKIVISRKKMGIKECARNIYSSAGFRGFWKGFSPCLGRAIITGSMRFMVFDKFQQLTSDQSTY